MVAAQRHSRCQSKCEQESGRKSVCKGADTHPDLGPCAMIMGPGDMERLGVQGPESHLSMGECLEIDSCQKAFERQNVCQVFVFVFFFFSGDGDFVCGVSGGISHEKRGNWASNGLWG